MEREEEGEKVKEVEDSKKKIHIFELEKFQLRKQVEDLKKEKKEKAEVCTDAILMVRI